MGLDSPNGVAFDGQGKRLYVTSFVGSGVYVIELGEPGALGRASVFARPNGSSLREPLLACPEQVVGSDCTSRSFTRGQCQTLANVVDCATADPCPGLQEGDECDYPISGTCQGGLCLPRPAPCQGASNGDLCLNGIYRGACVAPAREMRHTYPCRYSLT